MYVSYLKENKYLKKKTTGYDTRSWADFTQNLIQRNKPYTTTNHNMPCACWQLPKEATFPTPDALFGTDASSFLLWRHYCTSSTKSPTHRGSRGTIFMQLIYRCTVLPPPWYCTLTRRRSWRRVTRRRRPASSEKSARVAILSNCASKNQASAKRRVMQGAIQRGPKRRHRRVRRWCLEHPSNRPSLAVVRARWRLDKDNPPAGRRPEATKYTAPYLSQDSTRMLAHGRAKQLKLQLQQQ